MWGSANNDQNGYVLGEAVDCKELVGFNDGRATRIDVVRGSNSVIDLSVIFTV